MTIDTFGGVKPLPTTEIITEKTKIPKPSGAGQFVIYTNKEIKITWSSSDSLVDSQFASNFYFNLPSGIGVFGCNLNDDYNFYVLPSESTTISYFFQMNVG